VKSAAIPVIIFCVSSGTPLFLQGPEPFDEVVVTGIRAEDQQVRAGGGLPLVECSRSELLFDPLIGDDPDLPQLEVDRCRCDRTSSSSASTFACGLFCR
jgi:hypothetical protein